MVMKVVDGNFKPDVEVDEELREMAKDLRYVANCIERGEISAVGLSWIGRPPGTDDPNAREGSYYSWGSNGGVMALAGTLGQLIHEINADCMLARELDEDEE